MLKKIITSEFQKTLIKDTETLRDIVKLFHPCCPDKWVSSTGNTKYDLLDMLSFENREARQMLNSNIYPVYCHYDWVCIRIHPREYGRIDICVSNYYDKECKLWGPHITGNDYLEQLKLNNIAFKGWTTTRLDCGKGSTVGQIDMTMFFLARNYKFKDVSEFLEYYYRD